jgi:hypothetical protein
LPINISTNPLLLWFDPSIASTITFSSIKNRINASSKNELIAFEELKIVSIYNKNMIEIYNIDPRESGLVFMSQDLIFTTTGLTIFIVYIITDIYDYITLFTTGIISNSYYPISMYNNQRILNDITSQSKITIGKSDDNIYITLYTVSINILSGSAQWYEAIYNKSNTRKSNIIFPNVTSFKQDKEANNILFGGTNGWDIDGTFYGNIGEILVYNNFLDPTISSVSSLYNKNVSYLKNKWNI